MPRIKLLIVAPARWAATRAEWLTDRGYEVAIWSNLPTGVEPEGGQDYDLILLDEVTWLSDETAVVEPLVMAAPIIMVATNATALGHLRAIKAGAVRWIHWDEDRDTLIRTIEEVLRGSGALPKRGRVLLVDDDERVLEAVDRRLTEEGYEVCVVSTREDALAIIPTHQPHVAIVDFVLPGPKSRGERKGAEPPNQSGFWLSLEIDERFGQAMRVVGMSAFTEDATAVRTTGRLAGYVHKGEKYEDQIVEKVKAAHQELEINHSLVIDFEAPLSLNELVRMMKVYRNRSEQEKRMAVVELEELLRKAFHEAVLVKGYYLSPGRGGSGVVLMRPVIQGINANHCVVKFGPRDSVAVELERYLKYAQFFITHKAHLVPVPNGPIQTHNLGALMFSVVTERPQDFNAFYRNDSTTIDVILEVLNRVFNHTCRKWYNGKRDWVDDSPGALARAYEMQLDLNKATKQQELSTALEKLLDAPVYHGLTFRPHSQKEIILSLGDIQVSLPNPLEFVQEHRVHFRPPLYECITHGDLNGRNMFVDDNHDVWLIDFFKTGWGPILRDFNELETVIRFELIETHNLRALYEFERAALERTKFDQKPIWQNRFHIAELDKLWEVLSGLHRLAQSIYESDDMYEYYVGLLYYALKMITWDGISSADRYHFPTRQRHALMTGAMIAYRLQHWDNWSGWPV